MTVYLGLGSNLGDRFANLQEAVNCLCRSAGIIVTGVSAVYETAPVGGPDQPDYLNAAIGLETTLAADRLLEVCLETEKKMGRVRDERWNARIIDIDILLFDGSHIRTDSLTVPHPRMHERGFVLVPLADIAPDAVHPLKKLTVTDLVSECDVSGIVKLENYGLTFIT